MNDLINIIQKFAELKIKIGFGFEFEFYILDNKDQPLAQENFISIIQAFLIHNQFPGIVYREMEVGQIEIASIMSFDIENTIEKWLDIFEKLKVLFEEKGLQINHLAKPFLEKAGNGMHINISLHNVETNENLFGTKDFSNIKYFDQDFYHPDIKNSLLAYSIGGVLSGAQKDTKKYLSNNSIIERIKYPDRNSPTNISCGYNNRTTLLRIPETLQELKRLENRLPSSENDLQQVTTFMLADMYEGIIQKIIPQRCTFGLAFDEQYDLKKLKF